MKIALTGPVQLELIEPYFRKAGYALAAPGERADLVYDVTSRERTLAEETPGFYDARFEKLAGCPYSLAGIGAIVEEFGWELASRTGPVRKLLAVDADNTLWDGILSEDGRDALVPRREFQDGLRSLAADGAVLVLLSKNDPGSIDLDWFAVKKVNWAPKAGNLIEACRELNLAVDAAVFVDDNPYERAEMAAHLPSVAVAPWHGWGGAASPHAERQLLRRLREYFFAGLGRTAEDRLRAADYARRAVEPAAPADREGYLKSLGLWVEARQAEERDLDRLAQMAGKTNQFNATTRRRPREEFARLIADSGAAVFVFRAGDRFGEQGIVAYVIVDRAARRITDFVMSCRAMGRTLEHYVYDHVTRAFGAPLPVDFVASAKNGPFAAFLATLGSRPRHFYRESFVL